MTCLHCSAETSNGLALCALCQRKASDCLESLPVYFRNLARWRPGRAGGRQVPSSREPAGENRGAGDRVSRALDEAGNAISTWARMLEDERGITAPGGDGEAEQVAALCAWLSEHLTSIATLEWAGEFIARKADDEEHNDSIAYHEARLRGLTATAIPGWYAGACRQCSTDTYVIPGLIWVTCAGCGTTTFARDHIDTILGEARGWVARPKALAGALVALLDTELSVPRLHERIRQWSSRNRITAVRRLDADGDEIGAKSYLFGEVLDVLIGEGATRTDSEQETTGEAGATLVTFPLGGSVPSCA